MNNSEERKLNEDILRQFDSEATKRADGSIRDSELAGKLVEKNDAKDRLAEMAKQGHTLKRTGNVKLKDILTEPLASEDGEVAF